MLQHWRTIRPLLEATAPRVLVEVGVFTGKTSARLLEFAAAHDATVHLVDPVRHKLLDLEGLEERYGDRFVFHEALSLDALPRIRDADTVLLDGDHNWYTAYNELISIAKVATEEGSRFPLTLMHDVDWPYGRRDLYYDPDSVPAEHRLPYARAGVVPGRSELAGNEGMFIHLAHALEEGTPRNGVRTALEDFLAETDHELVHKDVIGFHGLAILVDAATVAENAELRSRLEELDSPDWLRTQCRRLEDMRLRHYTQTVELLRRLGGASERADDRPAR
jgi:SAM-dependent methyltransferase